MTAPPTIEDLSTIAHALADAARGELSEPFHKATRHLGGARTNVPALIEHTHVAMQRTLTQRRRNPHPAEHWSCIAIDNPDAFAAGSPTWTTLIAALCDPTPPLGLIDHPVLGLRWLGLGGQTHQFAGDSKVPVTTSDVRVLNGVRLATHDPHRFTPAERGGFDLLRAASARVTLGAGAFAAAQLASGWVDLVVETQLTSDHARAITPVIRGAGGVITNWLGDPQAVSGGGQILAAATPALHAEAVNVLARVAA